MSAAKEPQPVGAWTWRRALRDHGPDSPGELLTLLMLSTYMDAAGEAWPSQALLAKAARCSKRTVQRHLATAKDHGWLETSLAGMSGQGWRHSQYQATVPHWVRLSYTDEEVSNAVLM